MFSSETLLNKTVLITGGGSGLGLTMAKACVDSGARVIITGRSEERLKKAVEGFNANGKQVIALGVDVRDNESVEQLWAEAYKHVDEVNVLINNAAGNFYSFSEDLTPNGFSAVVETVLFGTFFNTRQFAKRLIDAKKPGLVLSIATTYAASGSAYVLPSACAKAGVVALTKSLAYERAPHNIRLIAIAPGPFPTPGAWDRLMPGADFEKSYRDRLPLKRFGKPEELGALTVFLLSELAEYINGEVITIDGGESLQGGQFNFLTQKFPRETLKKLFSTLKAQQRGGTQ